MALSRLVGFHPVAAAMLAAGVGLIAGSGAVFAVQAVSSPHAPGVTKTLVCHMAGPSDNWTENLVSVHAVDDANGLNGHGNHAGDIWASYMFDGVTYPGQGDMSIFVPGTCNLASPSPTASSSPDAAGITKVPVCHMAGQSGKWTDILVSVHAVNDANGLNGHGNHAGDFWASYVFDGVTYPGQGDMSIFLPGTCNLANASPKAHIKASAKA